MRKMIGGLALAATFALGGCDTDIWRSEGLNAPEDVGPLPSDYRAQATAWARAKAGDPAATITVFAPSPDIARCNVGVFGSHFGWMVPVKFEAKDGCGDCEGMKTMYLWFSHGKVEHMSYFPSQC